VLVYIEALIRFSIIIHTSLTVVVEETKSFIFDKLKGGFVLSFKPTEYILKAEVILQIFIATYINITIRQILFFKVLFDEFKICVLYLKRIR
jgi:hypothetical protein